MHLGPEDGATDSPRLGFHRECARKVRDSSGRDAGLHGTVFCVAFYNTVNLNQVMYEQHLFTFVLTKIFTEKLIVEIWPSACQIVIVNENNYSLSLFFTSNWPNDDNDVIFFVNNFMPGATGKLVLVRQPVPERFAVQKFKVRKIKTIVYRFILVFFVVPLLMIIRNKYQNYSEKYWEVTCCACKNIVKATLTRAEKKVQDDHIRLIKTKQNRQSAMLGRPPK